MPTIIIHRATEGAPPTAEMVGELTRPTMLRIRGAWVALLFLSAALGLATFVWGFIE